MILGPEFFERSSIKVARDLIGCFLCRRVNNKTEKFLIVETESYEGREDLASHASRGETPRNEVMFGKPGVWYVYFTYGMHYMLNVVCGKTGHPGAVLIRGITHPSVPSLNLREGKGNLPNLVGPARLTKHLGIDKTFNGLEASKKSGLWIEDYTKLRGPDFAKATLDKRAKMYNLKNKLKIIKTPRIGVGYSGPIWSKKPYRFVLAGFETKRFK